MKLTSIYYLHEIGGKKNQEDYIWPVAGAAMRDSKIFIICDGVGGSDNGEVASRIVAEYVGNRLLQTALENISLDTVNHLLADARQELIGYAARHRLNNDMATTFTLLVLFQKKAFVAWCGDSRVYHIRKGNILYETSDHSLVNSLVKKGEITEQDALVHPQKHIILKAITGDDSAAEAEGEWIEDLKEGDYFMLCTDGLLENVTDDDLRTLLDGESIAHKDLALAIQEKCFGKTRDNYSMYLLQISLQEDSTRPQQKIKKHRLFWFLLIILALAVAGLFFFVKTDTATYIRPAAMYNDSLTTPESKAKDIKKDTILVPGKNEVEDSEILNREEPGGLKIAPPPLPENKTVADTNIHATILPGRTKDNIRPQLEKPLKITHPEQKKDSAAKHGSN